jgi:ATP/maltotriose-dependent transcriptional regulator MalT
MKPTDRPQPILRTKLQAPQPKPDTLRRQRLLDLIGNQLDRRLLVITGDAGYGKTTLLAQVREQGHLPCVFISLEQSDSDLVTFFSCLVLGLERLQPGLASRCQGHGCRQEPPAGDGDPAERAGGEAQRGTVHFPR